MSPTVLITRPAPDGERFADQVRAQLGCKVPIMLSPLIRIETCGDLTDLSDVAHLIFTSRNGVAAYAKATERRDIPSVTVGDATAEAARQAGLQAISCRGNSADLIAFIIDRRLADPFLHVRGEHATGEILGALNAAGLRAREKILYRQKSEQLCNGARGLLSREIPVVLPLFSPRSAQLLFSQTAIAAPLFVAALSRNVAGEVPEGAARKVTVAERPDTASILAILPELVAAAWRLESGRAAQ